MTGALDRAEPEVAWEYCRTHRCDDSPVVNSLGEGCYYANGEGYECSFDAGQRLQCRHDTLRSFLRDHASARLTSDLSQVVFDGASGSLVFRPELVWTGHCAAKRASASREERSRPHPTGCVSARVAFSDAREGAETPDDYVPLASFDLRGVPALLELPAVTRTELVRSGRTRVRYTVELCADEHGALAARDALRSSGFAALDQMLRRELTLLIVGTPPPTTACALVDIVIQDLDRGCQW